MLTLSQCLTNKYEDIGVDESHHTMNSDNRYVFLDRKLWWQKDVFRCILHKFCINKNAVNSIINFSTNKAPI